MTLTVKGLLTLSLFVALATAAVPAPAQDKEVTPPKDAKPKPLAVPTPETEELIYTFINNCTEDIKLYGENQFLAVLTKEGGSLTRTDDLEAGYFYTDAHLTDTGKKAVSTGQESTKGLEQKPQSDKSDSTVDTKAVTKAPPQIGPSTSFKTYLPEKDQPYLYYYLVKDEEKFNVGINVELEGFADTATKAGFCKDIKCDDAKCNTAFSQAPMLDDLPSTVAKDAKGTVAPPKDHFYACPYEKLSFKITFCPSGAFPAAPTKAAASVAIKSKTDTPAETGAGEKPVGKDATPPKDVAPVAPAKETKA